MNKIHITWKRVTLYIFGLFFLAFGVSISIHASLGVSPVSSLPYALSLTMGLSIGMTTILANILFILMQIVLNKKIEIGSFVLQFIVAFIFGMFMDFTLFLVRLFPAPENLFGQLLLLTISLFVIAFGLLNYFIAKLPLMPYDALTYVMSERFHLEFSRAKITSDLINVALAGSLCLIVIHSLGSIGIGTVISAYFLGKILGIFMRRFNGKLEKWIENTNQKEKAEQVLNKEKIEV